MKWKEDILRSNFIAKKVEKKCSENEIFEDVILNPIWYKNNLDVFNPKIIRA